MCLKDNKLWVKKIIYIIYMDITHVTEYNTSLCFVDLKLKYYKSMYVCMYAKR